MKQKWHVDELVEAWTLDEADLGLVRNKTGSTRLGFAVLLKFFEVEARFPVGVGEVPIEVVDFVAGQLEVDLSQWRGYKFAGASWKRHRSQIRRRYGFRGWAMTDVVPLTEALQLRIATGGTDRDRLRLSVLEWCRQSRIEPPVADQLDRFVGSAVSAWESTSAQQVTDRLGLAGVARIEALLGPAMKDQLSALRTDPGAVGVETVLAELDKLDVLRSLELAAGLFDGVSAHSMNRWDERFGRENEVLS